MGNLQSREIRHERRSSRRLSKPQTNTSSHSLLKSGSTKRKTEANDGPVLSDNSMMWKSPWTGDLLPKASPDIDEGDRRRTRSLPSFPASHSGPSRLSISGNRRWSNLEEVRGRKHERSLSHSSLFVSSRLTRRPSGVQLADAKSRSRQLLRRETQRSPIFYLGPSEIVDDVQEAPIEETMAENVATIEDRRFSFIRRKSFLKPGVARRNSQDFYRRPLSLIEQEDESVHGYPTPASGSPRWPLCEPDPLSLESPAPPVTYERALSPISLDYSHLGGLKRGSLRIVNGSASPAPSDRTRRGMHTHSIAESRGDDHSFEDSKRSVSTSPGDIDGIMPFEQSSAQPTPAQHAADSEEGLKRTGKKRSASLFEIPLHRQTSNIEDENDIPGSPFSFEKSPTTAMAPRQIPFSEQGMEDEAINLAFGERVSNNGTVRNAPTRDGSISRLGRQESRSLTNTDSGYSSVSSVHSEQTDRTSRSPDLSESPPQHTPLEVSTELTSDFVQEDVENPRRKSWRRPLRQKSKEADLQSAEQPQYQSSPPLLPISTRKARNRRTSDKPHHCCHSPPRFHAQLGLSSVPSVPTSTTTQNTDSDTGDGSDAIEFPERRRRFSTSQLKLGFRRSGFIESGTICRSDGEDFIIENPRRNPETENNNDRHVNRSVDTRERLEISRSTPSRGSRVRSLSEPSIKAQPFLRKDEQVNNRNRSPFQRRQLLQHHHDIPPVPSLPSLFDVYRKARMRQQERTEVDVELPRGRARTRSIDQSRKKLVKVQRGSFQHQ
ncbi:hypothetical protein VTN77DRAFT_5284 [Rasamsonia byssochlamydoides]|uniref:uncharacterized protein n=1 Tax=Rasamsonia byssochlamydoides TaxID=89139 RepID=UPI003744580D